MKKQYTTLLVVLLTFTFSLSTVFAQSPEKMSYQAVVRDASNNLLTNSNIGMRISILTGSVTGIAVYTETQIPKTNANGLVSIEIGTGTTGDDFSAITWETGIYFIKTETDPTGGSNYTITGTTQLLSVPYALHAKTAANTFSGNYSDLIGSPINVSEFLNDAGYLASFTETDPVFGAHVANGITSTNMTNWNTAYGWGDHSAQGYLASFTETDPEVGTNTTNYLSKWNGDALVSSSIFDNGNVGIGTNEPSQKLEVDGNISADEFHSGVGGSISANYHKFRFGGTITGYAIGVSSSDHVGFVNAWSNAFTWRDGEGYGWVWRNQNGIGWMSLNSKEGGFYLKGKAHFDDNVGIGTDNPAARLEVADTPPGTNDPVAIRITNLRSSLDLFWELRAYDSGSGGPYGRFSIFGGLSGGADKLVVTTTGNVGIGTIDPPYPLSVTGTIQSSSGGFMFPDGTVQETAAISSTSKWSGTTDIYYNDGNVGIGTTAPADKLHVDGTLRLGVGNYVKSDGNTSFLGLSGGDGWISTGAIIQLFGTSASEEYANSIRFLNNGGEAMRIAGPSGNVGIGTIDPKTKLQVVGLPEYADNAAAITAGLTIGAFYRTGDFLKVVH